VKRALSWRTKLAVVGTTSRVGSSAQRAWKNSSRFLSGPLYSAARCFFAPEGPPIPASAENESWATADGKDCVLHRVLLVGSLRRRRGK
jgi:hypothetical protein